MYPHGPQQGQPQASSQYPYNPYPGYQHHPNNSNILAIVGIVLASVGLVFCWVPFLGLILAAAGIVFAAIALGKGQHKVMSITGLSLGSAAALISLIVTGLFIVAASFGGSSTAQTAATASPEPTHSASSSSTTPSPTPSSSSSTSRPSWLPKDPDLSTFPEIDDRKFAQVVKDPEEHQGEKLIVHGKVQQLDSATGGCYMLAEIGSAYQPDVYDYTTNSAQYDESDSCSNFDPLVEKDNVKLWVVVAGSKSYDTQAGGNTTVPAFAVYKAEIQ